MTPCQLYNIGEWVALPVTRLTIDSPSKVVRAIGYLSVIPLAPLFVIGTIFFIVPATLWEILEL